MYCPRCGASIPGKEAFCSSCGERVADLQPPAPEYPKLKGVGGWLLLLCVLLTIVFPLNAIYATGRSFAYHPDALILVLDLTNVALAIFSLVAGVMLWRVQNNALAVAKTLLLLSPLHAVCVFCVVAWSANALYPRPLVSLALRILALPFLFSLLCYWYLLESRRVKSTYRS